MLKAYVCVFLFVFQYTIWDVRGNGYYGGDNADDSNIGQGVKSHKISGPDTSISSLPQYESAGTGDQNYWWQTNNPFQRPANHPGVEKGDSASSTPQRSNQQPSSYQNKPQLHPTSHSRPNVFTPPQNPPFNSQPPAQQQNTPFQSQNPPFNPINSKQPNQQFQQNSPAFASSSQPNSSPYGQHTQNQPQINFPSAVDEECQLMNKADCHQASRNPQTPPLPNTSYQPPPPGPASKPTPFKPHNNNINNNNGSPQKPSTNYKPPSYGSADDEPINSHLNPQSAGDSNKFSSNQGDIEAPSYGPISDDSSFPSPSDPSPNQPTQNKPNQPFQNNNNPFSPNHNKPGNAQHQPANPNNAQQQPQQPYDNQPAPSSQGPHQSYQGQPGNAYSPQKPFQGPGSRPSQQPGNNQQESQQTYDNQAAPSSQRQPQAPQQPFQGPSTKPYSPQKPFQGPSPNTYSPPNTPQRNPNANNNPQAFRPNPPQNNFNNNPGQQQRPNNFQSANNQGFAQNSAQSAPRPGNNDSGDQVPYPGCPAAMLCVPDDSCNIKGIIEERPGGLTDAERSHRVAVVACSDPMTGTIGICCRDPNYKDPWPDMNMNGMPKKEHHHHPDKGNNFPVNQGNHQQQASSSFPSNSRQPQNFPQQPSQNFPQQQSQNFPQQQQQPHQPQQQRNPPQQQYQSQSSQQQYQPQQQQQQQAQKFGGYPSDGKNGTANKAQASNIIECSVHEDCVETYNCQDGYVIQNNSLSDDKRQINLRITTIKSRKCNTLKNGIPFACCRRNTINSIKHEIAAASSTNEQTVEATSNKPIYENNYHLQNTFKPQPSRLISGIGRIPGHENIHERFLTNRRNPYSQSQPPIVLLTKPTEKSNKTEVISLMTLSRSKSENNISTTLTEHLKPSAIINKPQTQENTTHIIQGSESALHLGNINSSNKTQQENLDTTPAIISENSELNLDKNSSAIIDSKLNATSTNGTLVEEYIPRIVTTTTTPKPYVHNGIPVPLSEEFKQNPPVGCIHKGSEFHIEPLQLPARNYIVPVFEFDDGEDTTTTSSATKNSTLEGEEPIETTTNSFSAISVLPSQNHTDSCPNYMICIDQAICRNASHDRLNNATSHTQCLLPNSKLTGVCCGSSAEKKNSSTEIVQIAAASSYSEEHCGIRRSRVAVSKNDTSETFFGEFPWQVMILNKSGDFICSGALLDKRTIITTANCIYKQNSSNLIVRVGEWNRHNNLESEPTEDISIASVILHPEYDSSSLKNDIAVVFLNRNVTYDYHIGKVCLPPTNENFESKRCLSTGWAASRKAGSKSSYLKQTDLLVLSQHTCQGRLQYNPNLGKRFIITKGSICARGENQDVCDGDIGDPLVCKSSSGEYQLVGLSVWTRSCSHINVPGVYVNISYHTHWIKLQMNMISSTNT